MKKKVKRAIYNFIKCGGVTATIAVIVILVVYIKENMIENQQITIIDWTIFTSIIVALLLNSLSKLLQILLMNRLEDSVKLTCDYEELTSKYVDKMIVYDNTSASKENLRRLRKDQLQICIPVICEFKLGHCAIEIQDSTSKYKLPDAIQEHSDELFAAHSTSKIYNAVNIRVDDWKYENKKFIIKTSRTTYFDSLITNRVMDFPWDNGMTIRERFEFGPNIHALKDSRLSNHIGFNGFVESSDGHIMFVKRGNKLSIGKRTYGNSIGAILKAKYSLNSLGEFTENGLINGILYRIRDELKIPKEALEEFSFDKHIIAAYRDVVEGGKPQLLIFIRSYWTKDKINQNFMTEIKKVDKRKKFELLEDGKKLLWISIKEINQICILPDRIIFQGKSYRMMPSATASIVMLIECLRERG